MSWALWLLTLFSGEYYDILLGQLQEVIEDKHTGNILRGALIRQVNATPLKSLFSFVVVQNSDF